MNPVLIVRSEIICLVIMLFIMLYSRFYNMGKDQGTFLRICIFGIGHIVFDLLTVLTVNSLDTVAPFLNRYLHIIFYMFALLYSHEFFCYTVSLCYPKKVLRKIRFISLIPILLYFAIVHFLPMYYLTGDGTNYSFGPAAIVGYGVAMVIFLASIFIVLLNCKKMDKYIVGALLPMLFAAIAAEVIQIAVPEMLFTGGTVTIITVGFFFSLENPVAVMRQKVLIDALTGVKSRYSYETDIVIMEREFSSGTQFGIVFCDINDLKSVNDKCGHLEGDNYIGCVAQILTKCLKSTETIYRFGGDEFLAVYRNKSADVIRNEVEAIESACEDASIGNEYQISVAVGYALSDKAYKSLDDVIRMADYQMYSHKAKIKEGHAFILNSSDQLNISGLTDRIFDAFADSSTSRFLFVTNMATNVTRWSRSAVEYFGMDSEFIFDCGNVLLKRIYPDDRDAFFDEISSVFSGNKHSHDIDYRIKNGSGDYVVCSSSGTVLRGKNGDPDLFAGTMFIRSAAETIDNLTYLRNGNEMMNYFDNLIRTRTPAALIKLSIINFSRLNMLYGYLSGNEIIRQFSSLIRELTGKTGSVFRSDGTKFVICLPGVSENETTEFFRKLRQYVEQHIHLDTVTPPLQLAAGVYMLRDDFDGTSSMLRSNLIFAHDRSKYEERGRLVFYDNKIDVTVNKEHKNRLLSIHQDAIAGRQGFFLVYQPIVNAKSGRIIGAEALLRWKNDSFGVVTPDSFIPWLEGDPCFFALGNVIMRRTLIEAEKILAFMPDFTININISMSQLEHEDFRNSVLSILSETGFPPSQLFLELTERCRELNSEYLKNEIEFFRQNKIRIALDDLGTGFSSFGLLLSLNVDEIKLDRSFVKEIRTQRVNQILTRLLIDASNNMGYSTCLEGVQDEELCKYLQGYGATYYQGYYCSPPVEIDEFISHTKQWNSAIGERKTPNE